MSSLLLLHAHCFHSVLFADPDTLHVQGVERRAIGSTHSDGERSGSLEPHALVFGEGTTSPDILEDTLEDSALSPASLNMDVPMFGAEDDEEQANGDDDGNSNKHNDDDDGDSDEYSDVSRPPASVSIVDAQPPQLIAKSDIVMLLSLSGHHDAADNGDHSQLGDSEHPPHLDDGEQAPESDATGASAADKCDDAVGTSGDVTNAVDVIAATSTATATLVVSGERAEVSWA